jgi:hypothetical protein
MMELAKRASRGAVYAVCCRAVIRRLRTVVVACVDRAGSLPASVTPFGGVGLVARPAAGGAGCTRATRNVWH